MQISEVMKRTGLSRKAIYLYEEKGLLTPGKVPAGELREYREYTEEDVKRLRLIARLRELDMPISDIEKALTEGNADMVLQNHLKRQQEKAAELMLTVEKLNETLAKLPPNATGAELGEMLESIISDDVDKKLGYKLHMDCSRSYTRSVTMLMFEAFLDKPLSTKDDWNAWYGILEEMESCVTPKMLEAHDRFYGDLTPEQLREDYALRRRLVCGYTNYGPMEESAKADELMAELKVLITDEEVFSHWYDYYTDIVQQPTVNADVMRHVIALSYVYENYEARFIHMKENYLTPMLRTTEGAFLKRMIIEKMDGADMFDHNGLIYFDFYNNTIRRVRYENGDTLQNK